MIMYERYFCERAEDSGQVCVLDEGTKIYPRMSGVQVLHTTSQRVRIRVFFSQNASTTSGKTRYEAVVVENRCS